MRKLSRALVAMAATTLLATAAEAQDLSQTAKTYSFEIRPAVGVVFPLSPDELDTGWDIGGSLRAIPPTWPIGLQLDLFYVDVGSDFFQASLDALYQFPTASGFDPYVIGGLGLYDGNFGLNAGVGADFAVTGSPLGFFVEGRFHLIFSDGDDVSIFPLNAGVRLRF